MEIGELKPGTGNVAVTGTIVKLGEPRDIITKFGKKLRTAEGTLEDETGSIKLSLWGEDADRFSEGDRVKVENGWVSSYKGDAQLSAGKFGKITPL